MPRRLGRARTPCKAGTPTSDQVFNEEPTSPGPGNPPPLCTRSFEPSHLGLPNYAPGLLSRLYSSQAEAVPEHQPGGIGTTLDQVFWNLACDRKDYVPSKDR